MPTGTIVVELFESQGCSDCPPAEKTMSRLQQEFGDSIIPLAFHVDYFNHLGWKDVYSLPEATERQKYYGQAFAQDSIFTPEIVIAGQVGFNGADTNRAVQEIRRRLAMPQSPLSLKLTAKTPRSAVLEVHVSPEVAEEVREILVVMVEDAPPVHVLRGENRGATMSGTFAVRSLRRVAPAAEGPTVTTVTLPEHAHPSRTRVAVLVRGDSTKFLSAASLPWKK